MSSATPARASALDAALALLALAAALVHDAAHVVAGRPHDVLWICNVAALLVGPALLTRSPLLAAIAFTWLLPGTAVWMVDLVVSGSSALPTSYVVHLGGSAAAAYAVARNGAPRASSVASLAVLACAVAAARLLLSPETNVNAAHAVPGGWSFLGGSRAGFVTVASGMAVVAAIAGERLSRVLSARGVRLRLPAG